MPRDSIAITFGPDLETFPAEYIADYPVRQRGPVLIFDGKRLCFDEMFHDPVNPKRYPDLGDDITAMLSGRCWEPP